MYRSVPNFHAQHTLCTCRQDSGKQTRYATVLSNSYNPVPVKNDLCSVDSLRSSVSLVWADHTQRILRKRFFCLCAGRTVFYGAAAIRAPRSGFDCPANFTHYNRPRSIESLGSSDGVVSEHTIPGFLPDSYYLMMQEGGPSIPKTLSGFCQSAPLSDFSHGACRPLFIVTDDSCDGRHLFNSALFSTDARTFFSRQSNNEINPVVSLSILKNKSAIPGAGRGLRQPAFLLRAVLPIAVSLITQIGISRSFPAQSIPCRSVKQYPIINLIPQRFIFLRDGANFGWVTRYDPMERAARFSMESEPQDWILHKGLKGDRWLCSPLSMNFFCAGANSTSA